MTEVELEDASTRRVMRRAVEVIDRELDVLYADKRDNELTIATQNALIAMHESEKEEWKKERFLLEGNVELADDRKNRAYEIADTSIIVMYLAIAAAFLAIGYAVWLG